MLIKLFPQQYGRVGRPITDTWTRNIHVVRFELRLCVCPYRVLLSHTVEHSLFELFVTVPLYGYQMAFDLVYGAGFTCVLQLRSSRTRRDGSCAQVRTETGRESTKTKMR